MEYVQIFKKTSWCYLSKDSNWLRILISYSHSNVHLWFFAQRKQRVLTLERWRSDP